MKGLLYIFVKGGGIMEMCVRKQKILSTVIEHYILTGEPISSKLLSAMPYISLSSATIRNELSELTEMGYLVQPHTSAGRVPSQAGYRYYVDKLMPDRKLSAQMKKNIADMIPNSGGDPRKIVESVGAVLAHMTGCAALTTTPAGQAATVRKIELIPVGKYVSMLILLTSNGMLKNRLCRTDAVITEDMVSLFYNIVNKHFLNAPVAEISTAALQTIAAGLGEKAFVMTPLLVALTELISGSAESEVHLDGQMNLLGCGEYGSSIRELLEFLSSRDALQNLVLSTRGMTRILIGQENAYRQLENSSTILCKYDVAGKGGGVIGIIGPTRLDYASVIPSIQYVSTLVGNLLADAFGDE